MCQTPRLFYLIITSASGSWSYKLSCRSGARRQKPAGRVTDRLTGAHSCHDIIYNLKIILQKLFSNKRSKKKEQRRKTKKQKLERRLFLTVDTRTTNCYPFILGSTIFKFPFFWRNSSKTRNMRIHLRNSTCMILCMVERECDKYLNIIIILPS